MNLAPICDLRRPAPRHDEEKGPQAGRRASQELCAAILNALGRDERLRRDYVRRRWCGLIEEARSRAEPLRRGG
jgi:hypothetical protein